MAIKSTSTVKLLAGLEPFPAAVIPSVSRAIDIINGRSRSTDATLPSTQVLAFNLHSKVTSADLKRDGTVISHWRNLKLLGLRYIE